MVAATGTTDLSAILASPEWHAHPGRTGVVATLVAVAAFTKAAQFPFHGWLPDAMVASTPVSAYLHAAAMVKAALYLLLRFTTLFHDVAIWNVLLVGVGLWTAIYGAVLALQRHDLKELLAYSTISQLGLLVATIGLGTAYAVIAAIAHVLAHAVFKSGLFMAVGLIDHEAGTRDIRRLSGLRRTMPWTSATLVLTAASMAGVPLFFGFVTKEAIFKALTLAPFAPALTPALCVIGVASAAGTFAYSARMLRPLFGPPMHRPPHEAPAAMIAPVAVTALAGVVLGIAGPLAAPLVDAGASAVLGRPAAADLSLWHGVNWALGMSVIAIALGLLLVTARAGVDRALVGRALAPVRAVDVVEAFRSGSVRLGAAVGAPTRSDAPFRHLIVPLALFLLATAAVTPGVVELPPAGSGRRLDWLIGALVCLGVVLTLRARSRVALVTTVGIVGFAMALLFYSLGAPDVAVTQLLVEILTVVVMVLLLVRLPDSFHRTGPGRAWVAGVLSAGCGVAGCVVTLVSASDSGPSPVGREFLLRAKELTGGTNVVNTILVDFRAIDTLGEMVVLGTAALALVVALESRGLLPFRTHHHAVGQDNPAYHPVDNTVAIRVIDRVVGPVLLLLSGWFFLRGHYQTGGGFIGALVAGAAVALIFLAAGDDWVARLHIPYLRLIGLGIIVAVGTGLLGLVDGAFLRPLSVSAGPLTLSTGLIFDVGVYLAVLGLIVGAIARLGLDGPDPTPLRRPGRVTTRAEGE